MNPIVIIGTGLAGYTFAREFRKLDESTPLVLMTKDLGRLYSKPMLSNALTRNQDVDQLATFTAEEMQAQLNAKIITEVSVNKIDPEKKMVYWDGGEQAYSRLVLASGARPIKPNTIKGDAVQDILSVNSLVDYDHFRASLKDKKQIALIGSGLIGCEFANDLVNAGFKVDVASFEKWPLFRLLPEAPAQLLQKALTDAGVNWHLDDAVVEVNHAQGQYEVVLNSGDKIMADVVMSAIGIVPDLSLANDAGLKTDKGIVVDEYLKTSADSIYALGDCVEVDGMVLPFVLPIMHCSRALAKTLSGAPTKLVYPFMSVTVKTPAHPVIVSALSDGLKGEWTFDVDEQGAKGEFLNNKNELLAFLLTGDKTKLRGELTKRIAT